MAIARSPPRIVDAAANSLLSFTTSDVHAPTFDDRRATAFGDYLTAVVRALPVASQKPYVDRLIGLVEQPGTRGVRELGTSLEVGIARIPPQDVESCTSRLKSALEKVHDPVRREALLRGYAAAARRTGDPGDMKYVSEAMRESLSVDTLAALSRALASASGGEVGNAARAVALAQVLDPAVDIEHLRAWSRVLVGLAPVCAPSEADTTARMLIDSVRGLPADTDEHAAENIGKIRLEAAAAAAYSSRVSDAMVPELTDIVSSVALINGVPKNATFALQWRGREGENSAIRTLIDKNIDPSGVLLSDEVNKALKDGLSVLTSRQPAADASARMQAILGKINGKGFQFEISGIYLSYLAARSSAPPAADVDILLDAIRRVDAGRGEDSYITRSQIAVIAAGLRVIVDKTPPDQLESLGTKLIVAMKSNPQALLPLSEQFRSAMHRLPAGQEAKMVALLLHAIPGDTDSRRIHEMSRDLASLIPRVPPSQIDIRALIDVLRYPGAPRQDLINAMAQTMPGLPVADGAELNAIKLIAARSGQQIDLDASAR